MSVRLEVRVDRAFPYQSTDPERPGLVHAVLVDGVLICSREAFDQLKALSDKGPDAFDAGIQDLLRPLGVRL